MNAHPAHGARMGDRRSERRTSAASAPPPRRRRSWTSSRRSPGPAVLRRPWLRRSGASAGRRAPHAQSATWRCRSALARCRSSDRCRSAAQRSTTGRLGPGGPPSLRKHCQTGLSDVGAKKSQAANRVQGSVMTRGAWTEGSSPREKPHGARHGCLLTGNCPCRPLAAPKPTPWRPDGTSTRRAVTPAPLPTPEGTSRPRAA